MIYEKIQCNTKPYTVKQFELGETAKVIVMPQYEWFADFYTRRKNEENVIIGYRKDRSGRIRYKAIDSQEIVHTPYLFR